MKSDEILSYDLLCIFSVPCEASKKKLWVEAIEKHQPFDYYLSKFHVCELHFTADSIKRSGQRTVLHPNVVPTIFPLSIQLNDDESAIEFLDEDASFFETNSHYLQNDTSTFQPMRQQLNTANATIDDQIEQQNTLDE